jgi:hypothetical protein
MDAHDGTKAAQLGPSALSRFQGPIVMDHSSWPSRKARSLGREEKTWRG